ncbi:metallophosphoesterase [Stenotrophomonas nitritireducens]|uniref:STAND family AAA ATPase n=1 Tax=Stenotrophomonas nitritireducens TaxID=83617 RepID=UPI003D98694F
MSLLLVHLSDIHIKTDSDPILKRGDAIAAALNPYLPSASLIVIVVSGDVAFSGAKKQYAAAKKFFDGIRKAVRKEARCDVEFLICPGNHDCDFEKNNQSRKNNILGVQGGGGVDDSVIKSCTRIQDEFFRFRDSLETWKSPAGDRLWRTVSVEAEGRKIVFDALNVSWVSNIKEDKNLFFPFSRYQDQVLEESSDIRFIAFHHPLNWFSSSIYRPFRKFLRDVGSVLISGHEHEGNVGQLDETESGKSIYVEGRVLQEGSSDLSGTGFFILEVDLQEMVVRHSGFEYFADLYRPQEGGRTWQMPSGKSGKLAVSPDFRRLLEDAGAISHPDATSQITLQDIYVYPDLRKVHERGKTRKFVDSKILLSPSETRDGVILKADERTGSTSLLYQLFMSYLEQGFVPILIRGNEIKRASSGHIDDLVSSAIRAQYMDEDRLSVAQRSRSEKIVLVDDIDESKVLDAAGRAQVLGYLRKIADHMVVVVSGNFGIEEILEEDNSEELVSLEHYEIQPFGYSKRSELVKRWIGIGHSISGADLISECDKAERLIASAMHKSLIPSAPLYLLTLLQSINAGKSADLKESSLGHYYEFLLTEALLNAGVSRAKLTEHYQYATYLAWEFGSRGVQRLEKADLRDFNKRFSAEFFSIEFESEVRLLLNARILIESGGEYEFRYPYMYYHLKGRYLSANLHEPHIRDYVSRCCGHLYVRDYANTILFLAHHSNSDWLLDAIKGSMAKLFDSVSPVRFNGDTVKVNELISDAPALVYKGGTPEQHREKKNKDLDELDESEGDSDGLMDKEESSDHLSLSSQIVMLFKTTEILGQILKNQYSTIRRPMKRALLQALFDGSLRSLSRFYSDIGSNSDKLVARVRKAIVDSGKSADHAQRDKLARRFLAEIVQSISVSIIGHAALSINSDELSADISDAVREVRGGGDVGSEGAFSYRIIELAVVLDSAKPIPRALLADLYAEKRADLIANRIIKLLVLTRLYMFRTTESDMQWIASTLDIPLSQQHQITYSHAGKKVK